MCLQIISIRFSISQEIPPEHRFLLTLPENLKSKRNDNREMLRFCGMSLSSWGTHNIEQARFEVSVNNDDFRIACIVRCLGPNQSSARAGYVFNLNKNLNDDIVFRTDDNIKWCLSQETINRQIRILTLSIGDQTQPCGQLSPMEDSLANSAMELYLFTRYHYPGRTAGERTHLDERINDDEMLYLLGNTNELISGHETRHFNLLKSYLDQLMLGRQTGGGTQRMEQAISAALSTSKNYVLADQMYQLMKRDYFPPSSHNNAYGQTFTKTRIDLILSNEVQNIVVNPQNRFEQGQINFYQSVFKDVVMENLSGSESDNSTLEPLLRQALNANNSNYRSFIREGIAQVYRDKGTTDSQKNEIMNTLSSVKNSSTNEQAIRLDRFIQTLNGYN